MTTLSHPPATRRRRGFTLTEAAIVMGIAGVVLGAVWAAANAAIRNRNLNETATNAAIIVQNMRTFYRPTGRISVNGDLNEIMLKAGVFPAAMLTNGGLPVVSVWSTPVTLTVASPTSFSLSFGTPDAPLEKENCIGLVTRLTGKNGNRGLLRVETDKNDWTRNNFGGITPSAITPCNRVTFTYDIKG